MLYGGTEFPKHCDIVWAYYNELHYRRSYGEFGPKPISYLEIHAWSQVTETKLNSWQLSTILALDSAFMSKDVQQEAVQEEG